MKLDVDSDADYGMPLDYVQTVSSQLGSLMQLFGLRYVKSRVNRTPAFAVPVMTDARLFDFADESMTPFAMSVASWIASLASSVGISSLSLGSVSDEEKASLLSTWKKLPSVAELKTVVSDGSVPDMKPIEVDL